MNKKGDIEGILVFVTILFLILIVGFLMIVGGAVIDWVFDESVPELTNLGQIENLTLLIILFKTLHGSQELLILLC